MINRRGVLLLYSEISAYWNKRLVGSGINTLGIHPDGGHEAISGLDRMIERTQDPQYKLLTEELINNGIDIEYEAHTLSWMLPRSLFETHPDWFRVNSQGDRTPDINFCASNKDAVAYIEDSAQRLAGILVPTTNRYFYWSDDVDGDCFCHCEECRKYTPSDQYMIYANAVLRGTRRVNPLAMQCYLAYFATIAPPSNVEPENGIFLEYAPLHRDQYIPIDNVDCEQNRLDAAVIPDLISCFGSSNSQVLEYWLDNSRFSNWRRPFRKFQFDPYIMRRDVDFYIKSGFECLTSFGCWLDEEYYLQYGEPPFADYVKELLR